MRFFSFAWFVVFRTLQRNGQASGTSGTTLLALMLHMLHMLCCAHRT